MDEQLTCIIHLQGEAEEGEVKKVDEERWKKLEKVVSCRRNWQKQTRYDSLLETFPAEHKSHHGYHSKCYKNFTAIPKALLNQSEQTETLNSQRRSSHGDCESSSTGVLPRICIFCGSDRKRKGEVLGGNETPDAEVKIRAAARQKKDEKLLTLIGDYLFGDGQDFVCLEAKYHHGCKREYLNEARPSGKKTETYVRNQAKKLLLDHIKESVVSHNIPELANSLLARYVEFYKSNGGKEEYIKQYDIQSLCRLIKRHIDTVTITGSHGVGSLVYKTGGMSYTDALKLVTSEQENKQLVVRNCARILRDDILKLKRSPIDTSSVDSIMKGEVSIPPNVSFFYQKLYNGEEPGMSHQRKMFVDSSAADAVYCCSGTKMIPGKHISLGLTLKSMTGSKRVLTLMQRNGHCCSSETTRRIDMGMERGILNEHGNVVPQGVVKEPGLSVGTAWDNYDINLETINGLGSIHHTYGIVYQNITSTPVVAASRSTERRSFSKVTRSACDDLQPYHKKPKIFVYNFVAVMFFPPENLSGYQHRNLLWICAKILHPHDIPMWHGWTYRNDVDIHPKQRTVYMQHIELPPTRYDVVMETLVYSQKVSEECG